MEKTAFGKLPGEIRNQIYDYALREANGIHIFTTEKGHDANKASPVISMSGLPYVCRMLRNETLQLYFSCNCLVVHCDSQQSFDPDLTTNFERLAAWCDVIGLAQTQVIHKVTFVLRYEGSMVGKVISILQQEIGRIRPRFHRETIFDVNFQIPCWDKVGRCLPVNIVLGNRDASLARMHADESERIRRDASFAVWRIFAERRLREAITNMSEDL